jgi:hypothetical protein
MLLFGSSLILASSVGASRAQGQTSFLSNLTGRIIDSVSGNAVSGAAVTIAALNLETQSNSDGHFSIDAIGLEENPQAVDISVQADGYGEWRIEEVLLVDKDTLILNVEMGIDPVTITMPPPRTEAPGSYREAELGIALDAIEMDITEPALPETIIVRVYGPPYSPCNPSRTGYETQEIDFKEYVKHVLPNEWIYSWPGESLRAGAMAAKMYGWFWVDYPGSWDVRDDVCDQVYNPAVEYQSTNDAVDFTWNWRMLWGGDFKLIHYVDGIITTCDAQGWSYCIEQWGTYWHALGNNGYEKLTWDEMLEEYYDPQPSTYPLEITPVETPPLAGFMLRFYGNGWGDIDRVKIPIDPHVPLDIGDDFTLEWWMKADPAENGGASCTTGAHEDWIYGNTIFDRDVFGAGDYGEYGVSIAGERLAFGVNNGSASYTLCGGIPVADHSWHHVAVTRLDTGEMAIFVDGMMDAVGSGPPGEVSYRDARSSSYPTRDPYLVIGAEKHDEGTDYPSYSGFLDEIRMSDVVRYSARFTPPSGPFSNDDDTIAIYHFDEGRGDTLGDSAGSSDGQRRYGGFTNGPEWFVSDLLFLSPRIYLPLIIR